MKMEEDEDCWWLLILRIQDKKEMIIEIIIESIVSLCALLKSNPCSPIINDKWHKLMIFVKKVTEMANLIDGSRDKGPNWDILYFIVKDHFEKKN